MDDPVTNQRPLFDPSDPFDALADRLRTSIAETGCAMQAWPEYRALQADGPALVAAVISGMLTASCGVIMSHVDPRGHAGLRDAFVGAIPDCFDQARSIMELPPLQEANRNG